MCVCVYMCVCACVEGLGFDRAELAEADPYVLMGELFLSQLGIAHLAREAGSHNIWFPESIVSTNPDLLHA